MFVGSVSDNFDERIEQKIFHAEIVVDNAKVAAETKAYKKIPVIADFTDDAGNDVMQQVIDNNYNQILKLWIVWIGLKKPVCMALAKMSIKYLPASLKEYIKTSNKFFIRNAD